MSATRLTPGKASLLMLGIGTASLVGLPDVTGYDAPQGALVGLVVDEDGLSVPDAPVALFEADSLNLVEIAHTDDHGRFALQQAPERFHLCVRPEEESGLLTGWALDLRRGPLFTIDVVLRHGSPVDVLVTDDEGRPVADADVRVYGLGRNAASVLSRARTSAQGRARVIAPATSHIGVFGPKAERLPAWHFQVEVPEEGSELAFVLPRGRRIHGRVRDEDGRALDGIVVSAWDQRASWQWNGYRLTGEDGAFAIYAGAGAAELRALDQSQELLPTKANAGPTANLDLTLAHGKPLQIRCENAEGEPLPARVWLYSEASETWSWGSPTNDEGTLRVVVAREGYRAVARPLYRGSTDLIRWTEQRRAGTLELVHQPD